MPGLIDVHAHVGWHFDKDGRYAASDRVRRRQEILYAAENAYVTLLAGFTTIQSPGQANDVELRAANRARRVPRPADSDLDHLAHERSGTPDEIRQKVRSSRPTARTS